MERQIITVDISPHRGMVPQLRVSQGDIGRPLGVYIMQDGAALDCSSYSADLYILKSDGNYYVASATVDSTETNLIIWSTEVQETPVAGECAGQIRIRHGEDDIGTARFVEYVEASPGFSGAGSESAVESIKEYVRQAAASAETASGAASSATGSASAASGSASAAASSASAAARSASSAHTDAETASQAAQTAQDVADSIPEDYSTLSNDVSGLKSAIADNKKAITDGIIEYDTAEKILFYDLDYYSLDANGALVEYPGKKRLATVNYHKATSDMIISSDSTNMIICIYNENYELLGRYPNMSRYQLSTNDIFRVCVVNTSSVFASTFIDSLFISSHKKTISTANRFIDYDTSGTIYFDRFGYYSLDTSGNLVAYNNFTKLATPDYYKCASEVTVEATGNSVVCTYNDNYQLINRITGISFTIPANTFFRVCVINTTAFEKPYSKDIYIKSKVSKDITYLKQAINEQSNNNLSLLSCFHTFVGIGDSLMAGFTSIGANTENSATGIATKNNWFDYLLTRINRTGTNLAHGSSTIHNWRYGDQSGQTTNITEAENINTDCYFVGLGVNDVGKSLPIGSTSDIKTDMEQNADTVYGNLDYILRKLKGYNPYAKIFVFTIPWRDTTDYTNINTAITNVCSQLDNVYCIELPTELYDVGFITNNYSNGHFNPITYNYMSTIIENLVNKYIYDNYTNFVWIPYHH